MGKTTKKSGGGRKPKQTFVPLPISTLRENVKRKIIGKRDREVKSELYLPRISKLLNEEVLSCTICLQLLLRPVLAQCGHSYCLFCSEDLAKNGYACGICHTHLPTYDLQHSHTIEKLVNHYLDSQEIQERQNYLKRIQEMQRKQENRRIKDIFEGNLVDFWCEEELTWKSATVTEKMKNGTLTLAPLRKNKQVKQVSMHIDSRRLAPHRTFAKEEPIPDAPQFQFRALNLAANQQFEPVRMRMPERPYIFGMPLFLGYYWRDEDFRVDPQAPQEDQQFPF